MNQTQNLRLNLPEGSDWADVTALNENMEALDEAVSKKADLGEDGKIPASQLPEMNYDPAGSAAAVQANLSAHIADKNNPHVVTAAQIGAFKNFVELHAGDKTSLDTLINPGGYSWIDSNNEFGVVAGALFHINVYESFYRAQKSVVQELITTYPAANRKFRRTYYYATGWTMWSEIASLDANGHLPPNLGGTGVGSITELVKTIFPAQKTTMPSGYNFAVTGPGWSDNGYMPISALASLLVGQGLTKMQTLTYTGTGTYGASNPNTLTFSFAPKLVIISACINAASQTSHNGIVAILSRTSNTGVSISASGYSNVGLTFGQLQATWSGNSLSWYCKNAWVYPTSEMHKFQGNTNGAVYSVTAFG